jgi:ABC-type transport system substrate-binding protein
MRRSALSCCILVLGALLALVSPVSTYAAQTPLFVALFMSPAAAPTSLADFRRAIASSIDREAVVSAAQRSASDPMTISPATSVLDPRLPGFSDGGSLLYPYNPAEAKRFLSNVGWTDPITITIVSAHPSATHIKAVVDVIGRTIQDTLGLKVSYRYLTPKEAQPYIATGSLPLFIAAWVSGSPSGATPNSIGIARFVYGRLPDIARLAGSNDATAVQRALLQQALVVPLYFTVLQK